MTAALVLALLFAGCGSRTEPAATPEPTAPPTAAPTAEPTPEPTPEPTATPEPTPEPTAEPVSKIETAPSLVTGVEAAPWLLQGEEKDLLYLCWMGMNTSAPVYVAYGPDPGDGTLPPDSPRVECGKTLMPAPAVAEYPWQYRAELRLEQGVRYVYGICQGDAAPEAVYPLCTDSNDTFSFVCVSDTHVVNRKHCAAAEDAMESAMAEKLSEGDALDGVFHLGDIVDQPGMTLGLFTDNVPFLRSFPLTAVAGNHDSAPAVSYHFPMPHTSEAYGHFWYLRDRVLVIGVNIENRYFEKHAEYVRSAIESAGEHDWTILLIHYSMRDNGYHSRDGQVIGFRRALEPVIHDLDVDLVISGHDHEYDRVVLLDSEGPVPGGEGTELTKLPGQVLYVTVPTSTGVKYYDRNREAEFPMAAEGLEQESGYVLVDVGTEGIRLRIFGTESGIIDDVSLRRSAG